MGDNKEINKTAQELLKIISKYDLDKDKKEKVNIIIKNVNDKTNSEKYLDYINTFLSTKNKKEWDERDMYQYLTNKVHYDKAKDIFSKNLQYYMKIKNKNVTDLSNDLWVSYSTVNDWYNGRAYPRPDKIEMLAKYLDVNTSDLTEERTAKVPVLGRIPAGIPNEAIEYIEDWEEIPASWLNSDKEYFALRIKGTSMTPKYQDGDIVIFQRASRCDSR